MKKYITITALLAAGTACANAAELIAGWDFNNAVVSDGITSFAATSGNTSYLLTGDKRAATSQDSSLTQSGWANDLTAGGAAYTGSSWFENTNSIFSDIATEATAFTIMLWVNTPIVHNMAILGTGENGDKKTSWGNGFKWGMHDGKILFTAKSVQDYGKSTSTVAINTWTHLAISITAKSSGFDVSYFVNGNAAGTASDDRAIVLPSDKSKFYLGAKGAGGEDVGNYYFDELKIYSGAMTQTEVAAEMVKISTVVVPEPSAFGLLAGIGALALVASRRRRK